MRNHLFLSLYATAATAGCAASARGRDVAGFAVLMTERGTSVGGGRLWALLTEVQ
jgi:hypothetical protein